MNDDIFDRDAEFERRFHVHEGPSLSNLQELLAYLPDMSAEQFAHHVHDGKNDFARWIRDVHGPGSVVKLITGAATKEALAAVLRQKKEEYKRRATATRAVSPGETLPQEVKAVPAQSVDEDTFTRMKDEYARKNEEIQERFENIATDFKEALEDKFPGELQEIEDTLSGRYEEIRARISDLRKKGKDLFIAAIILRLFPPKLRLAHASRDRKLLDQAETVLDQVEFEIAQAAQAKEIDVRKEVMALAGAEEPLNADEGVKVER